jgi:hypothetical protein
MVLVSVTGMEKYRYSTRLHDYLLSLAKQERQGQTPVGINERSGQGLTLADMS